MGKRRKVHAAVESPREPVYYYECSGGRFRLTCFIPPEELEQLCRRQRIAPHVLEDFPDGVDLDCSTSAFEAFQEAYGFLPKYHPTALQRAFLAILSDTRNWRKLSATGFIPAADLEGRIEEVDGALMRDELIPGEVEAPPEPETLRKRRQWRRRQMVHGRRVFDAIQKLHLEGIDPKRTLPEQEFSRIRMSRGRKVGEVFTRLHQKRTGKE